MEQSIDAGKACRLCRASKPPEDYVGLNGQPTKTCAACRAKRRGLSAEEAAAKATYRRTWSLSQFGITTKQYDQMLESQGGVCAICANECATGRRLTVDHDHVTGRVRALLCTTCNRQLGIYEAFHARASGYLAKYGDGNPLLDGEGAHMPVVFGRKQGVRRRKLTDDQVTEIRRRYAAGGVPQHALAAEFGVSQMVVSRVVREVADEARVQHVRAFVERVRKLSDEDVADARLRHENGESIKSIARSLGVAHTTISGLVNGKYWASRAA